MPESISMDRRSEFRVKARKPKAALWLGCVVKSAEERVSKAQGMPYIKLTFENCPFVCVFSAYDMMAAERVAREYGVSMPVGINPGDMVNLDVRWRKTPDFARERFKNLGEYEARPKLELYSWLGVPDQVPAQIPVVMEREGNVSWATRWMRKIKEWF
ncbi:hypothetical protein P6F35_gp61 [Sphingomonas phage vB_StuS_MMDA13]|uniref:Uncharacterized protein n=1 Tax=Sphingomonas phage vB_StuS_MMDA13 TaxID=2686378 RepID=A0A7G3PIQ8_9CAUD|nr:hypothetical protein P6F35_gp61 [Sphingomonas phage vB_StuS_MMDA13]QHB80494.1 hypothetical protein MMDA13_gp61 [Sphingomonas phage vB_StuS_MMDA13]